MVPETTERNRLESANSRPMTFEVVRLSRQLGSEIVHKTVIPGTKCHDIEDAVDICHNLAQEHLLDTNSGLLRNIKAGVWQFDTPSLFRITYMIDVDADFDWAKLNST